MLKGEGITKRFGGLVALNRLDFEVKDGEVVGLIGPNGSGKTTLFNVVSGFYLPEEGTLTLKGEKINGKRPFEITRMGIGRTFQIVKPLVNMTVLENVAVGKLYGRTREKDMGKARRMAEEILYFTGLERKKEVRAGSLVLADRKRLEIARALAIRPDLLLLDEVFAGLNQAEMEDAIGLIKRIQQEMGVTIFIIEHVMKAIMRTCGRILVLHHGEKIAEGTPGEVTRDPKVIEAYLGNASSL